MAYASKNYPSKKALKEAVADPAVKVTAFQPGLGPDLSNYSGKVSLEGPHYPKPHKWYASAVMVDGEVVKVG